MIYQMSKNMENTFFSPQVKTSYSFMDPPLSTKLEKRSRYTPGRRTLPRLSKTMPSFNRYSAPRESIEKAVVVSCKPPDKAPILSKLYNPNKKETYFDQVFIIEKELGVGSFGEVYQVKSREDGRRYAVKCALELYRNSADRRWKLREAEKHEMLPPHANLVRFYMAWEEKQRLYIQTELCETSLDKIAENNHEIPESDVWKYFIDILLAVDHLHKHDILHVDIKPANIFVSSDGVCKLGDFGLIFDLNKDDPHTSEEGDSKYLASEVLNDDRPTKAADIFSLGITVLELATDLDLPTSDQHWHTLRSGHIPTRFVEKISPELRDLIVSMMDPSPTKRPTTKELLENPFVRKHKLRRQMTLWKHETARCMGDNFAWIWNSFLALLWYLFFPFVKIATLVHTIYGHDEVQTTPYSNHVPTPAYRERTSSKRIPTRRLPKLDLEQPLSSSMPPKLDFDLSFSNRRDSPRNSVDRASPDLLPTPNRPRRPTARELRDLRTKLFEAGDN